MTYISELSLTTEWDKTFPKSEKVNHSKVTFHNRYGITLAADMYEPKEYSEKLAAIAVCGPFGAVIKTPYRLISLRLSLKNTCTADFGIHRKTAFQLVDQQRGYRRKYLMFFPYDIHFGFKARIKRSEAQLAVRARIDQAVESKHISEPFFYEYRSVISQIYSPRKIKRIRLFSAPSWEVEFHPLRGAYKLQSVKIVKFDFILSRKRVFPCSVFPLVR